MGNRRAEDARTAKDRFGTRLYLKGYERAGTSSTRGRWIEGGLRPWQILASYSAVTSLLCSLGQIA